MLTLLQCCSNTDLLGDNIHQMTKQALVAEENILIMRLLISFLHTSEIFTKAKCQVTLFSALVLYSAQCLGVISPLLHLLILTGGARLAVYSASA